jgi:hypothetical protein
MGEDEDEIMMVDRSGLGDSPEESDAIDDIGSAGATENSREDRSMLFRPMRTRVNMRALSASII